MNLSNAPTRPRGWTLLEMIVAMTIIALLLSLVVPSYFAVSKSMALTQSGGIVFDALANARLQAIANNRSVEVRFYDLPDEKSDDKQIRFLQIVPTGAEGESGDAHLASSLITLHGEIAISRNPRFTNLLKRDPSTASMIRGIAGDALPMAPKARYVGFRFAPDGTVELPAGTWFLTLAPQFRGEAINELPDDYFTISIDPTMGKLRVFRP